MERNGHENLSLKDDTFPEKKYKNLSPRE